MTREDRISSSAAVPVDLGTDTGGATGQTDIGSTVKDAAQQTQQRAGELVDRARQQGEQQITTQKERAANGLESLAGAIRRVGGEVRSEQKTQIADLAETAAAQTERLSRFLRETDVNQLVNGVQDFARRQPALFLGGAVAVGAVAARFIKASTRQAAQQSQPEPVARYEAAGSGRTARG